MNTLTIILLVVGVVLAVVGASQRKRIALWVRSEVDDAVTQATNTAKVAKIQLKDIKVNLINLVDQAGELKALELAQIKQLGLAQAKGDKLLKVAKKAKEDDNMSLAKAKIQLKLEVDHQIILITENIATLKANRTKLEANVQKIKNYIAKNSIRLEGAAARKKVSDLLKKTTVSTVDGETLEESIDNIELDVTKEEDKLEYISNLEDIAGDSYEEDVETAYKEL